jgi:hypothetical protein
MNVNSRWIRRRALALAVAALCVAAISGTALAGHQTSGVKSYTGCLVGGDGVMIKIKEGDAPRSRCTGGQVEAHFSGGDISKISAGTGVTVTGGDNGEATISLNPKFSLPQGCAEGEVAKWDDAADEWACAADNDTKYTADTGLVLSQSNQFSIASGYRVQNTPDCNGGTFATGFGDDGQIVCSTPSAAPLAYYRTQSPATITVVDDYTDHDIVRLDLPQGKYMLNSSGTIEADTTDGWSDGHCWISGPNDTVYDFQDFADDDASTGGVARSLSTVALNGVATLSQAASVVVQCKAFSVMDQALAERFEIVAVAVR